MDAHATVGKLKKDIEQLHGQFEGSGFHRHECLGGMSVNLTASRMGTSCWRSARRWRHRWQKGDAVVQNKHVAKGDAVVQNKHVVEDSDSSGGSNEEGAPEQEPQCFYRGDGTRSIGVQAKVAKRCSRGIQASERGIKAAPAVGKQAPDKGSKQAGFADKNEAVEEVTQPLGGEGPQAQAQAGVFALAKREAEAQAQCVGAPR